MSDKMRAVNRAKTVANGARIEGHDDRRRAIRALQGSLAHIPFSSDDFARLKMGEIEREERESVRLSPDAE